MSITILNYLDQPLADSVRAQAAERAAAAREAEEAAKRAKEAASASNSFSSILDAQSNAITQNTSSAVNCPEDLNTIFEDAASTYGVSSQLLKAIAKAESNFRPDAVSSAGAVGIMQLMPGTAASLGVSNSYDPRENIMGGARLIAQLLGKYDGNTSLALAAYNAGSGNVDKYGGIPPFSETQNYVKKVLSYMGGEISVPSSTFSSALSGLFELTGEKRAQANQALESFFSARNISQGSLEAMTALLKLSQLRKSNVFAQQTQDRQSTAAIINHLPASAENTSGLPDAAGTDAPSGDNAGDTTAQATANQAGSTSNSPSAPDNTPAGNTSADEGVSTSNPIQADSAANPSDTGTATQTDNTSNPSDTGSLPQTDGVANPSDTGSLPQTDGVANPSDTGTAAQTDNTSNPSDTGSTAEDSIKNTENNKSAPL